MEIRKITDPHDDALDMLSETAATIWRQHFASLLSGEQIEYMLEKFQSKDAMTRQLAAEGYVYYLALSDGNPAGYTGIVPRPAEHTLFLSKLYIRQEYRRRGLSKQLIRRFLADYSDPVYQKICLTCNKYNKGSLDAYARMGFAVTGETVAPIGRGMVMDDYLLELPLGSQGWLREELG